MPNTMVLTACLVIVATASAVDAPVVRAAEPAGERIAGLRATLANDPRVKEADAALAAADKAVEKKITGDPAIAEARRAEQAARENLAKAEQAATDADPRVQEQRRALGAARARASELEMQRRIEQTKTDHLRSEALRGLELRDLRTAARFDPQSPEAAQADPRLAATRRKLDEAEAALDRKMKELLKDLPEVATANRARREFDDAVKASQGQKAAEAARRMIEEKVAADEKVAAQAGKLKAAADAQAQQRKTIDEIERRIRDAAAQAVAKDARVQEATLAAADARARASRTIEDRAAAERKARKAAQAFRNERVKAVIADNPEAKALLNEMRSLEERLQKLRSQVGELGRPVVQ